MSTQPGECRLALSCAPDHEYCSPAPPKTSEPVIYVSPPYRIYHPEVLQDCGLCSVCHNVMFRHSEIPNCRSAGQGSRQRSKAGVTQDCPELLEASSMQTLDELVAKLEFENELNRVCDNFRVNVTTHSSSPTDRSHSTDSADSGVEEGDGEEDTGGEEDGLTGLLDMVLEMEQDYDLCY